jgi:hypothetical protein
VGPLTEESPTAWQKLVASLKKYLWELEPVFTAGTAQAIVALVVALFHPAAWVTGVIEAAFAIVAALYMMLKVEPKRPALFTGLVTAVGTLLVALGVPHVNSGLISGVNGVLAIVLTSLLREKVSPVRGQTVRQGLSQLRHPGQGGPQSAAGAQAGPAGGAQAGPAAGSLADPPAGAGMARFATDATAAADALAQVAADAKAMGAAPVPPPRTGDEQARDVTQTPP